jgi:hypothetical protein
MAVLCPRTRKVYGSLHCIPYQWSSSRPYYGRVYSQHEGLAMVLLGCVHPSIFPVDKRCFANAGILVVMTFFFPETLFDRTGLANTPPDRKFTRADYITLVKPKSGTRPHYRLHFADFYRPFLMLRYPSIIFPCLYYSFSFGFGTILPAVTMANLYSRLYGFSPAIIGLCLGVPLLIGSVIGEFASGPLSDFFLRKSVKRHGGEYKPEARLDAIWSALIILPVLAPGKHLIVERLDHFWSLYIERSLMGVSSHWINHTIFWVASRHNSLLCILHRCTSDSGRF